MEKNNRRTIIISVYINPQTNKYWREIFSKMTAIALDYQSRNFVVIIAGDFNMQMNTPKMSELKAILPNVICGASGFPRTGGIAK
jgi:hypothetical protein